MAEGEGIEPPAAIYITASGFEVREAHQSLSASALIWSPEFDCFCTQLKNIIALPRLCQKAQCQGA